MNQLQSQTRTSRRAATGREQRAGGSHRGGGGGALIGCARSESLSICVLESIAQRRIHIGWLRCCDESARGSRLAGGHGGESCRAEGRSDQRLATNSAQHDTQPGDKVSDAGGICPSQRSRQGSTPDRGSTAERQSEESHSDSAGDQDDAEGGGQHDGTGKRNALRANKRCRRLRVDSGGCRSLVAAAQRARGHCDWVD